MHWVMSRVFKACFLITRIKYFNIQQSVKIWNDSFITVQQVTVLHFCHTDISCIWTRFFIVLGVCGHPCWRRIPDWLHSGGWAFGGGGGSGMEGLLTSGGLQYEGGQLEVRRAPDGGEDLNSWSGKSTMVLDDVIQWLDMDSTSACFASASPEPLELLFTSANSSFSLFFFLFSLEDRSRWW